MMHKLACFVYACMVATLPALAFGGIASILSNDAGVFTGIFVFVSLVDTLMIKMPAAKK